MLSFVLGFRKFSISALVEKFPVGMEDLGSMLMFFYAGGGKYSLTGADTCLRAVML